MQTDLKENIMKFEIIRTDISKVVLRATDFPDAEYAAGQYIFALTMAGLMKSAADYTHDGGNQFTLHTVKGDWKIEARAV